MSNNNNDKRKRTTRGKHKVENLRISSLIQNKKEKLPAIILPHIMNKRWSILGQKINNEDNQLAETDDYLFNFIYSFVHSDTYASQIQCLRIWQKKLKQLAYKIPNHIEDNFTSDDNLMKNTNNVEYSWCIVYFDLFSLLFLPNFLSLRKFIIPILNNFIVSTSFKDKIAQEYLNKIQNSNDISYICRITYALRLLKYLNTFHTNNISSFLSLYYKWINILLPTLMNNNLINPHIEEKYKLLLDDFHSFLNRYKSDINIPKNFQLLKEIYYLILSIYSNPKQYNHNIILFNSLIFINLLKLMTQNEDANDIIKVLYYLLFCGDIIIPHQLIHKYPFLFNNNTLKPKLYDLSYIVTI